MALPRWEKSFWSVHPLNNGVYRIRDNEGVMRITVYGCETREKALELGNQFYPPDEYLIWADFQQEHWARNPSGDRFGGGMIDERLRWI